MKLSPPSLGQIRLISGGVLFVFVLGHFFNHMLGIVSLNAMNEAWYYTIEPWRCTPGTIILVSALVIHALLAVWALLERRTFKMKRWEAAQLVLGFSIPILLAAHVLSTRGGFEVYGLEEGYAFQLYAQWVLAPYYGVLNMIALYIVWFHACVGWHFWLRLKPWYAKMRPIALSCAVAIPLLATAGIISGGFRVLRLSRSEKWSGNLFKKLGDNTPEYIEFVTSYEFIIQSTVVLLLLSTALFHLSRKYMVFAPRAYELAYRSLKMDDQKVLKLKPGLSVLDAIKTAGLGHASVCGGRGRCSTCRVRIDQGGAELEKATELEQKVLSRIGAPEDVRLACQVFPKTNISVTALLDADASAEDGFGVSRSHHGEEQEIAVLFADIRAFTKLSEQKLPFDTAFLLNRYFEAMGGAIEDEGGHIDKFIGDGVMALFGIDQSIEEGCRNALAAARKMSRKLDDLNEALANDLPQPLKIGIGIHSGTAIVGNLGYGRAVNLTAIGDVVNTASRLESLTKEYGAELIVSGEAAKTGNIDLNTFEQTEVDIRGREQKIEIVILSKASRLPLD